MWNHAESSQSWGTVAPYRCKVQNTNDVRFTPFRFAGVTLRTSSAVKVLEASSKLHLVLCKKETHHCRWSGLSHSGLTENLVSFAFVFFFVAILVVNSLLRWIYCSCNLWGSAELFSIQWSGRIFAYWETIISKGGLLISSLLRHVDVTVSLPRILPHKDRMLDVCLRRNPAFKSNVADI